MADEEEKKAEEEEGEKPKGKPLIKFIIIGIVALLVVGGAGFFFLMGGDPEESSELEDVESEVVEAESPAIVPIYDLEPFVVNLADTGDVRYLKISIKLELKEEQVAEDVDLHIAHIRDSMLILLSSKDFESIRTVEGKMQLREEIVHRINTILNGRKVQTAYFTEFVSQ